MPDHLWCVEYWLPDGPRAMYYGRRADAEAARDDAAEEGLDPEPLRRVKSAGPQLGTAYQP